MKKLFFSLLAVVLFLTIFVGCGKDKSEPNIPYVDPTKPSIEVFIDPSLVDYGGSCTVRYTASNNTQKVLFKEVVIPNTGSFPLTNLTKDTSIKFVLVNKLGEFPEIRNITVRDQVFSLPAITLTATPDTLPIGGGMTTLSWVGQYADSVLVEDVWHMGSSGSIQIERYSTSTVSALAKGKGGETTKTITISVLLSLPTERELNLSLGTLTLVQLQFCDTTCNNCEVFWDWEGELPCEQDDEITFTLNPKNLYINYNIDCQGTNHTPVNRAWTLNGDYIAIENQQMLMEIITLTPNTFAFAYPSCKGDGTPIKVKYIYAHL